MKQEQSRIYSAGNKHMGESLDKRMEAGESDGNSPRKMIMKVARRK